MPSTLQHKRIIVGVTGSIAAYKSALLIRLLIKAGAEVQVIMTEAAKDFITPLTLATLSKRPVLSSFLASEQTGSWNNHVELGLWADVILIAPATAHTLAKCANGLCEDLLTAAYLSARCPVFFAPAMDLDMYLHPSTFENLQRLRRFGNFVVEAEHGELASGLVGTGRMAEPESIIIHLEKHFSSIPHLKGKKILITAGPTQEAIDPVRYISNHSTGKMGYAIAQAFAMAGADVTLISGPTAQPKPFADIQLIAVRSAQEMYEATQAHFSTADVLILSAAVADYTPTHPADRKIKKKEAHFSIELTKTVDIAATLGLQKQQGQFLVGFALETDNELENALGKLKSKNLDLIVLNSLNDKGAGFAHDTNKITVIEANGSVHAFALKSKSDAAQDILQLVAGKLH
ncbi:bifunctional phosphopantothenoylcysteine decarboxylase/phosphopantothenate--cysteine ligase CoaBC [Runella slithyformis]|uniref:Coenzyme A biosynthesis bifunctional protein CoaBC n=1 Tax=Runella slithyformis (strain ATCC 29530 / DSM 19594 / LMG 11500 / NCIMB 11436 / LSU 4) TaxID=761193 RepID=A0A7U3ZNR5_RUNSL|nr:bifunctional phosphopantothenoylcysteine decarboxylase/phosphopantothenate--cysteine ligase CoaBC [Runella slithyformis]AEI50586.1 phosphopantothenoylcysteine decarboxylase/phosphopantothenate/cysteine ligase [Runella slithyformis DSM 19594]